MHWSTIGSQKKVRERERERHKEIVKLMYTMRTRKSKSMCLDWLDEYTKERRTIDSPENFVTSHTVLVFDCERRVNVWLFVELEEFRFEFSWRFVFIEELQMAGAFGCVSSSSRSYNSSVSSNIGAGRRPTTNVSSSGEEARSGTTCVHSVRVTFVLFTWNEKDRHDVSDDRSIPYLIDSHAGHQCAF